MYTRCPHCSTFFAVSAAQLSAARGRVRCGSCLSIFDGLNYLSDAPPLPDQENGADAFAEDSRPAVSEEELEAWLEGRESGGAAPAEHAPPTPPTLDAADATQERSQSDPIPEAIQEDLDRAEFERRGRWKAASLTALACLLLLVLAVQYAWFQPGKVLAGYPQARSLMETFCAYSGCRPPDRRNPLKIQMLARDVRVHPRYEGALLVSATLVNVATHAQPYPRLKLSIFNVAGQTIASRVFRPEEYLSQDLDAGGDMTPGKPLQIALELIAPGEAAVSYEFRFL